MNERLRRLLSERASAWEKVKEFSARAEKDSLSPEDDTAYRAAMDETERLSREVEDVEREIRQAAVMEASTQPGDNDQRDGAPAAGDRREQYRSAFSGFMRRGLGRLNADQQRLLQDGYEEIRALGEASDSAGGYLVPDEFWAKMTESLKSYGGLINEATVLNTATGADIPWPSNDDTANTGALLSENTQATELDFTFGTNVLRAHMFTSKITRVPFQLLQDSAFALEPWLAAKQGERIGRALAPYLVSGTGTGQPQGLLTGLGSVTTTGVGAITFDDLIELEHSIDPAYRTTAKYVASDSVVKELRKKKDNNGQYLWSPALAAGIPSTINGRPYVIDNSMAAFANGAKPLVFGDIKRAFLVRQVAGSQLMRLTERYADFLQVGFLSFARYDAKVDDAGAARALLVKAA